MKNSIILLSFCLALALTSCQTSQPPNIIWLTCEDISPTLSMYGDTTAHTPNLDKLAAEGLIFNEAYATVGVCAPSRSSIITGMYPISIGTHNMRTGKDTGGWGRRTYSDDGDKAKGRDINGTPVPYYSAVIPSEVKCFSEYLRKAGYFCTNNQKTDYQFAAPVTAWDQNGPKAHWKNRKEGQPFFAVFNHEVTHESQMWKRKHLPLTVDPNAVPLPDYYPDTEIVRTDVARNYSNIEALDEQIGEKIRELEEAGVLDNTIIFFFSDHGGPLPRGKREHYESGLRVPFIVRLPKELKKQYVDAPISFVDLAPTVLSLAGIDIPEYLQGQAFLGEQKASKEREYIYGSGDRFDEFPDQIRSVISKDYVYVRNFHPELPAYKDVTYRKGIDMMKELLLMHENNQLNEAQDYWFRERKTEEEFYCRSSDPFSLHNLIDDPEYKEEIDVLRRAMDEWLNKIGDKGNVPEKELFLTMWPGGEQPVTSTPKIVQKKNKISLSCETEGASVAYLLSDHEFEPDLDAGWQVYSSPIELKEGDILYTMGTRIGFADSEIITYRK